MVEPVSIETDFWPCLWVMPQLLSEASADSVSLTYFSRSLGAQMDCSGRRIQFLRISRVTSDDYLMITQYSISYHTKYWESMTISPSA